MTRSLGVAKLLDCHTLHSSQRMGEVLRAPSGSQSHGPTGAL